MVDINHQTIGIRPIIGNGISFTVVRQYLRLSIFVLRRLDELIFGMRHDHDWLYRISPFEVRHMSYFCLMGGVTSVFHRQNLFFFMEGGH